MSTIDLDKIAPEFRRVITKRASINGRSLLEEAEAWVRAGLPLTFKRKTPEEVQQVLDRVTAHHEALRQTGVWLTEVDLNAAKSRGRS